MRGSILSRWPEQPLDRERALELLEPVPRSLGQFRWRDPTHGKTYLSDRGTWRLWFYGTERSFEMSRIVWLIHTGDWTHKRIRRRNGNPQDDRFENLYVKGDESRDLV